MIRIIIRRDNKKLLNDANIINNMIKNSFIYVSDKSNYLDNNDNILFNLYIDDILELDYEKFKLQKNILIANEKYYKQSYLVRYSFLDKPLLKIIDTMNYILCKFNFMYDYFLKYKNNIIKIPLIFDFKNTDYKNYYFKNSIYLNIDEYNCSENSLILMCWIKNNFFQHIFPLPKLYINIDSDKYEISNIFKYLLKINNNNIYKNITVLKKNSLFYYYTCSLITSNNYNIIYSLLNEMKNKKFIITVKNNISTELLQENTIYLNSFLIKDIGDRLTEYFNINDNDFKSIIEKNYNFIKNNENTIINNFNDIVKKIQF